MQYFLQNLQLLAKFEQYQVLLNEEDLQEKKIYKVKVCSGLNNKL